MMRDVKGTGGRIAVVAGPVLVHTGGVEHFSALIRQGFVDVVLAGRLLAVHDIKVRAVGITGHRSGGRRQLIVQYWQETTYTDESNYDLATRFINDAVWDALYRDVLRGFQELKR